MAGEAGFAFEAGNVETGSNKAVGDFGVALLRYAQKNAFASQNRDSLIARVVLMRRDFFGFAEDGDEFV